MSLLKYIPVLFLAILLSKSMAGDSATDIDHDRVPDYLDKCPNTPQLHKANPSSKYIVLYKADELSTEPLSVAVDASGCALNSDKDGVADYKDYCPENLKIELSAGIHANGCPLQSDGDGTPDYRDKCPETPIGIKTDHQGCPVSHTETAYINVKTSLPPE